MSYYVYDGSGLSAVCSSVLSYYVYMFVCKTSMNEESVILYNY